MTLVSKFVLQHYDTSMSTLPTKGYKSASESERSTSFLKEALSVETKSVDVDVDDLCDTEPEPFKLYNFIFRRHIYKHKDLDAIATRRSVYDDPHLGPHYWPKKNYENMHRFDVKARWTVREERVSDYTQFYLKQSLILNIFSPGGRTC